MEPFEILANPYTLYVAAVGTAFPGIDDEIKPEDWFMIGTSGDENYDEEGVTVTPEQDVAEFTPAGSTTARKAFRTAEGLVVAASLVDLSTAQHAKLLDDAAITTVAKAAGKAGEKSFDGYRGPDVELFALLCRGLSPEDNALNRQLEVPVCYQSGSAEYTNTKGEPAGLSLEYRALRPDKTEPFYTVRNQTDAAE